MFDEQDFSNNETTYTPPRASYTPSAETHKPPEKAYTVPEAAYPPPAPPRYSPEVKPKKKGSGIGKLIAVALCCSVLGNAIGAGVTYFLMKQHSPKLQAQTQAPAQAQVSNAFEGDRENTTIQIHKIDTSKIMTPAEVYAVNVQSTVGITTSVTTNFWGYQSTSAASGSGFILTDDGYVLTNYHVVEGSTSISVAMYDGKSYEADVVGYDEGNDIAVLKIDATGLTPVILGDSDKLNVGDSVVAIGNPLGELTFSLTSGSVSALDRLVTMQNGATMNLIQTDCAINSGNSGGALFNLYGEVIGITNAKYSGNGSSSEASIDNIGFAIPMSQARKIFESIIEKGYYSKPYIGVSVTDVSEETQSYGLPQGASIKEILSGSPAEKAGLQINDIITSVNGEKITGSQDLVTVIGKCAPGDTLDLEVYRKGQSIQIILTVEEQVQSTTSQQQQQQEQQQQQGPQYYPGWGGR